jgi:RHS repeat-associated protein
MVSFRPDDGIGLGTSCYEHIKIHNGITASTVTLEVTSIAAYSGSTTLSSISNPATSGLLPSDIRLELIIHTEKYRDLYSNATTEIDVRFDAPGSGANPSGSSYGLLTWDYLEGAEEYDVEWVYIDSEDDHSVYHPFTTDEDPFLYKEATRITTSAQHYEVPLTYPSGILYFRVRAVGRYITAGSNYTHVQPGEWSYRPSSVSSALSYTISTDFEQTKNWQYTIAFAEDGKRKQVMTYYDGSLRARQAAVDVTTDATVLVGETKYDYEGRPVVAVLPAPVYSKSLGYRANFTLDAAASGLFDKDNFDDGTSDQVGNTSGAGEYYSAEGLSGTFAGTPFQSYVPDAGGVMTSLVSTDGGYPYVQAVYKRDGTGRIEKQSGVGAHHYMGSGRETEYYYGNAFSTELHRMFGTNVGVASHYKKTMVVDPNNQASVAYMDQEGRVVATALTGAVPENLLELDSYDPQMMIVSLNDNNIVDQQNHVSTNISRILNTYEASAGCTTNVYSFSYDMSGLIYNNTFSSSFPDLPLTDPPTYQNINQCTDCKYHLNIKIYAPDGSLVSMNYNSQQVTEIDQSIENPATANCSTATYNPTIAPVDFTASFCQLGEYTVIKTLSLDTSGMHAEMMSAMDNEGLGSSYLDDLIAAYQSQVDSSLCDITCDQHCYSLIREQHPTWSPSSQQFLDAVEDCKTENCGGRIAEMADTFALYQCEAIIASIRQQVSPGGIFYEETDPSGSSSTSAYFWERVRYAIANSGLVFHNPDGTTMSTQPSLSTVQTAATFQSQWANDLAPYHREYCHYTNCTALQSSAAYDFEMATIQTWSEAATTGYLNPQGLASTVFDDNWITASPWNAATVYSSITGTNNDPYTTLPDASVTNDATYGNIWSFAADANNGVYDATTFPFNDANRWQVFRGLYLQIKTNYIRNQQVGTCPFYADDYAIVKDPAGSVNDLITNVNSQQQSWSAVMSDYTTICSKNVQLWMDSLSHCCDIDTSRFSQAELDEIADSLNAWCMRSSGMQNPMGLLSDQAVAAGELDNVIGLITAYDNTNPCLEYENPLQCASDPWPYQDTCIRDTVTSYFVTDCFNDLMFLLNDLVLDTYAGGGTQTCYETGGTSYMNDCSLGVNNALRIDAANNEFDFSVSQSPCETSCNLGLRFYDVQGNQIAIVDMISMGTPVFVQNYPCSSCTTGGTFRNIKVQIMTTYGPVMAYAFSQNTCEMTFVDSVTVDTCVAMLDSSIFRYEFDFDTLKNDCIEQLMAQAAWNAQNDYNEMVQEFMTQYMANHYTKCFSDDLYEDFHVEFMNYEHHYTLYYYDQADNLVRTVPPAGYIPVPWTGFSASGVYDGVTEPGHVMKTEYTYNSLNEVLTAQSPDGGLTTFFYDLNGRIVASQNAKQAVTLSGEKRYSYTVYDERSRIVEVGQTSITTSNLLSDATAKDDAAFAIWLAAGTHSQVMKTHYDVVNPTPPSGLMAEFYDAEQTNLRSRVSYVEFFEDDATTLTSASYYSYDIHGNVKEIVTDDPTLDNLGVRYKHMAYYYDLVSGKVNIVSYQNGYADQLWHRYQYDADNRLTIAETSSDSLRWERDAKYFYYLHGPLGRAEIGHDKVQGLDYAYTLHGWIKGINSNTIVASRDMGRDGALNGNNITASDLDNGTINTSNYNNMSAQDVFGYTLGYYSKDYVSVGTNNFDAAAGSSAGPLSSTSTDLFNGNISNWVMAFTDDDQERVATIGKLFAYDQLNRIRTVDCYADLNLAVDDVVTYNSFSGATALSMYEETFNYDPNGNIMVVDRTGDNAIMDDFSYHYKTASGSTYQWSYSSGNVLPADATNQLDHVDDDPLYDGNYTDDVDDQGVGNYTYDEIGNLIDDNQEQIDNIEWTIYGKIRRITRDASSPKPDLEFRYDAMGNRICKIVKPKDGSGNLLDQKQWEYSYYNRDASGNVMAVYKRNLVANGSNIDDKMTLSEQHLYGSSRLGLIRPKTNDASEIITGGFTFTPGTLQSDGTYPISAIVSSATPSAKPLGYRWMTRKNYELSNHLGNVYVVVKDKKLGIATSTYSTTVSYYTADVITANDYFAFGAPMTGRTYNSPDYRYQFNGKERDGETNTYDYGFRIYNASIGKFLSVDPLTKSYPWYTPYSFAGNKPSWAIDIDGLEEFIVTNTGTNWSIKRNPNADPNDPQDVGSVQFYNQNGQATSDIKKLGDTDPLLQKVIEDFKATPNSQEIQYPLGTFNPNYSKTEVPSDQKKEGGNTKPNPAPGTSAPAPAPVPPRPKTWTWTVTERVGHTSNKCYIPEGDGADRKAFVLISDLVKTHPTGKIIIQPYTTFGIGQKLDEPAEWWDAAGNRHIATTAEGLLRGRAEMVKKFLIERYGVSADQIEIKIDNSSYGVDASTAIIFQMEVPIAEPK